MLDQLTKVVLDAVESGNTKAAYKRALRDFVTWYADQDQPELNKATVQAYFAYLKANGAGAGVINQRRSAINKLMTEAADNGALDPNMLTGILRIKGMRREGQRLGNWLNKEQVTDLVKAPDITKLKGMRDRAILAILVGCSLRREECAGLTFDHVQQREGRWVILNLVGKRRKTRTVPIPPWAKVELDCWTKAAGIDNGFIFRSINRGGNLSGDSITAQALHDVVTGYSEQALGFRIAPHDLRRTGAKLSYKAGAAIDQISLTLGHSSIKTTEIYLGLRQDLTDAPCDKWSIDLSGD